MSALRRRRGILAGTAVVGLALALVAALVVTRGSGGDGRVVSIEPTAALLDASLRLEVDGVDAGALVRLELSATSADGVLWTGSRVVRAGDSGSVSVDGGSLLASLEPVGAPNPAKAWLLPGDGPVRLRLEARRSGRLLGTARATRRMVGPGVASRELTVVHDGLAGRYWTGPAGGHRRVAVLGLGGSEGGFGNGLQARLLASHGYPVLQLAYFGAPGLPRQLQAIPLEYVARAVRWLHGRPGVENVVVVGASRGGELALLLASTYPALVQGVAAYVPGAVAIPGSWTLRGKPVPPPSNPDPRIPVERIRGPVLVVAGGADQVWDSAYAVSAIRDRRRAHGRSTEALTFPDAGHSVALAIPYLPVSTEFSSNGFTLVSGGTRQADALARTASWPRLLALLRQVNR